MTDVPSTNVNSMDQFQQDVITKLRESIRDMLPDEVLKGMVQKAVTDEFFKPRKIPNPNSGYGRSDFVDGPSWFMTSVIEQTKPIIKELVVAWIQEHKPELEEAIQTFLREQNLMLLALSALQLQSYSSMTEFAGMTVNGVLQTLRDKGVLRF